MNIIFKPVAAVLLLCLSCQVGQVLAQKTARLSVSAVVTGRCTIRQSGSDGGYSVVCSDAGQTPQTLRLVPDKLIRSSTAVSSSTTTTTSGAGGILSPQDRGFVLIY